MVNTQRIYLHDDLNQIVAAINSAQWDSDNDLSTYTVEALRNYLSQSQDAIFLVCYKGNELAGIASANILHKPYDNQTWLYIDEIDVAVPHRRQGVGKALMSKFVEIATEKHCTEIWVGAEKTNTIAQSFYSSHNPTEAIEHIGYTFKL